jgi:hypothetical protein
VYMCVCVRVVCVCQDAKKSEQVAAKTAGEGEAAEAKTAEAAKATLLLSYYWTAITTEHSWRSFLTRLFFISICSR